MCSRLERRGGTVLNMEYDVVYADPPWRYKKDTTDPSRAIENQYPTMDLDEICALDVPTADPCVLFLWVPGSKVPSGVKVVESWGFRYSTCAVWDKLSMGMGYYIRHQHELLMIGLKGKTKPPPPDRRPRSMISEKRTRHSRKPVAAYEMIELMYPDASKIELFARPPLRPGWDSWGNEVR